MLHLNTSSSGLFVVYLISNKSKDILSSSQGFRSRIMAIRNMQRHNDSFSRSSFFYQDDTINPSKIYWYDSNTQKSVEVAKGNYRK